MTNEATAAASEAPAQQEVDRGRQRQALSAGVYGTVKGMIMDSVIAPGQRINIDALARDLRVSPTPVREALARLESEGLTVKEPNRGYLTTSLLTHGELADLYEFRLVVEPWAAAQAAARADEEGRARLAAEAARFAAQRRDGDRAYASYKDVTDHDSRFHDLLAELSGNSQLRHSLERTHCHLHLFRLYYNEGIASTTGDEHRRIVDAVLAVDPEGAAAAMRAHLVAARARLRSAAIHP